MAALPVEVLLGVYLGLLTGIIPAVVAWTMGFGFKYFTGVSIPAFAVVVLSLAIAGANGGLLALNDPTIRGAPNSITLTTAILVVLMLSLYTHAKGDALGASLPHHLTLGRLRERTLSSDVVDLVGGRGRVEVTVAGVVDMEGYPPLAPELRAEIRESDWRLPADLPLSELEKRVADALRTELDLADVNVAIDERGRATITAAPPTSGVSKRIPEGQRAVSVRALVPTGLVRGDEVTLHLPDGSVSGTVVSARSALPGSEPEAAPDHATDGGADPTDEATPEPPPRTPTTDGGDGRITVAVDREGARRLLGVERARAVVTARGTRREYELISLLRQAGQRFRKVTVGPDAELAGATIGDAAVMDAYGVGILALRRSDGWSIAPRGGTTVEAGDELFVAGTAESLRRFEGAVA